MSTTGAESCLWVIAGGQTNHICLRVALVICKVHGRACTKCSSTKRKQSPGKWERSAPWCSCHSRGKCSQVHFVFSQMRHVSIFVLLFLLTFPSATLCVTHCSVRGYFLARETHSAYQIISQMAAQMKIWWAAVCGDTATKAQANPDTLSCNCCTIYFLFQLMEWIQWQINKINISSVARVHRFSTLPRRH